MENALKNLFAVTDLRNRVLFTLALLGVYRVGSHIPTPGVNQEALRLLGRAARRTRCSACTNMFTGGNLSRVTIFALGVMPYISSSIILQLLTVVWPYLERISKEGELGRRKITQYTALPDAGAGGRAVARLSRSGSSAPTNAPAGCRSSSARAGASG